MSHVRTPLRLSPIHESLQSLSGTWRTLNGMPTLVGVPGEVKGIAIADLSYLTRFGVKGAGAIDWLAQQGIPVPTAFNTWCPLPDGGIVARLGMTEFLIEEGIDPPLPPLKRGEVKTQSPPELGDLGGNPLIVQLSQAAQDPPAQVYPVLRRDLAIALYGTAVNDLLLQTCSFDFRSLSLADHPVVLTSMIGVSVTVIPTELNGVPFYRIWCDGTFGVYFWETLLAIAQELGGGAIGVEQIVGEWESREVGEINPVTPSLRYPATPSPRHPITNDQ